MIRPSGCALARRRLRLRFKHSIQDDPVRASPMVANLPAGTEKDSRYRPQTAAAEVPHKAVVPASTEAPQRGG